MKKIYLDGKWEFSFTHPKTQEALSTSVTVPCNVEPCLVKLGLIKDYYPSDDPFFMQPFEAVDDWTFVKEFDAPELDGGCTQELVFEGIDTVAQVYLNGEKILDCEDMHLAYRYDVTNKLLAKNELKVVIRSSELWAREHPHDMLSLSRDAVTTYDSQNHLRKARHQWGWDNAPRLLSAGIVRSVYIEQRPVERFDEVYLYTDKICDGYVILGANFIYKTPDKIMSPYSVRISLVDGNDTVFTQTNRAMFTQGSFKFVVDRDKIKLWWPSGFGEPYLYTLRLEMLKGDESVAIYEAPFGIRTLSLDWSEHVTESDARFSLKVNGEPIYIRGTNWKPLDPLVSLADARLKEGKALEEIKALNCNMVRIWGGGIYEDEFFFDWCDRNGILIWQDFMFACEVPATDDEYCALVKKEAEYIVKKYRNHPSLAIWCGDNENDECLTWAAFNTTALPSDSRVTREILKQAVLCNDPYRSYVPSSPFIADITAIEIRKGHEEHHQTEKHLYVELYDQPAALRECPSIFLGETGPFWTNAMTCDTSILERESERAERLWNEEVIEPPVRKEVIFHQDGYYFKMWRQSARKACERLLGRDFAFSEIKDFTLALNILCAECFKDLIEYCRVSRPSKTGVIWWSLMDMWPMLFNYSVIDCNYNRKLPYYWIKNSQNEVALMGVRVKTDGELALYAANDTLEDSIIEYSVTAYAEDMTSRAIASGIVKQGKNSTVLVQRIAESERPEMWIIKWRCKSKEYVNHVFTGNSSYENMKKWVEILESEFGEDIHFDELELLGR